MKFLAILLAALVFASPARAGSYTAPEGQHFVAVASSKDRDVAIGIARLYGTALVVSSQNGWYAVVLGPTTEPSLKSFRKNYQGWPELPPDAVWSQGNNYIDSEWLPDTRLTQPVEVVAAAPTQVQSGDLAVTARLSQSDDGQVVQLTGWKGDAELFGLATPKDYYSEFGNTLRLAPLDPATSYPEVIVTQYTGGAHCCVASWIAAEGPDEPWRLIAGQTLDGSGYWLEDVDGDGSYELLNVDNSFLYAFESYAGSFATIEISQLRRGVLVPYQRNEAWKRRLTQDLAGKEFLAGLNPDLWRSNGFLAPWVATKIVLGEGQAAWQKMLANYEKDNGFGPQLCSTGEPIENCAAENMKPVPFPEALAAFLKDRGYTPVPSGG